MVYPRTFSHLGISVPDLDKAVKFYSEVMGWYVIVPPITIERDDSETGIMCKEAFGENWSTFRVAHLVTGESIGIEIFEFQNNEPVGNQFKYWKSGLFHFCVKDPDVEGLVKRIVESGGKQRMPVRYYYEGEKPYKMCYVEDPFGIVFEVYSHSYELIYSPMAYSNYKE